MATNSAAQATIFSRTYAKIYVPVITLSTMIIFEKLQQVKEMIIQLVVCCTIIISKTIIR